MKSQKPKKERKEKKTITIFRKRSCGHGLWELIFLASIDIKDPTHEKWALNFFGLKVLVGMLLNWSLYVN